MNQKPILSAGFARVLPFFSFSFWESDSNWRLWRQNSSAMDLSATHHTELHKIVPRLSILYYIWLPTRSVLLVPFFISAPQIRGFSQAILLCVAPCHFTVDWCGDSDQQWLSEKEKSWGRGVKILAKHLQAGFCSCIECKHEDFEPFSQCCNSVATGKALISVVSCFTMVL